MGVCGPQAPLALDPRSWKEAVHTCLFQAAVFLGRSVLFRLGRKLREVEILAFRDGSEIWGCLWGWTPQKETISNLEICVNGALLYLFIFNF